jgi:hypothetical protein
VSLRGRQYISVGTPGTVLHAEGLHAANGGACFEARLEVLFRPIWVAASSCCIGMSMWWLLERVVGQMTVAVAASTVSSADV